MDRPDFVLGHEPIGRRINVNQELRRIRRDPLDSLLAKLDQEKVKILSDDFSRYREAYWFYYLSFSRYLPAMSAAARYSRGPYWVRRSGGRYTEAERKLAKKHREIAPYLEFDFVNVLIHSRILLDRTVALARCFLTGPKLPSFTSFNEHKQFFLKLKVAFGAHEEYAEYMRQNTQWFEVPLKVVRDKFVVHASPKHMRFLGYPAGEWELDLNIMIPDGENPEKPLEKMKVIRVNAVRLSLDIQRLLIWFASYAEHAIAAQST